MDQWFRRNILIGAVGALAACSSSPPDNPPLTADWLLGHWEGAGSNQQLVITSVRPEATSATGTWAGEPVSIAVHGGQISFNTPSGYSVQLSQGSGLLIGTVDRAPWLPPAQPVALLALRQTVTGRRS